MVSNNISYLSAGKVLIGLISICLFFALAGCDENGGSGTDPNAGADNFTFVSELGSLPCNVVESENTESLAIQCTFIQSQYPVSISRIIDESNEFLSSLNVQITDDSRIWFEALGGRGGHGESQLFTNGGKPGAAGYARTAATIGRLRENILSDGDSLYVLVGRKGKDGDDSTSDSPIAGSGGSSSILIGKEILDVEDVFNPEGELVLLIAPGGGGGGRFGETINGKNGGRGGDSVSGLFNAASDAGVSGGGGSKSGDGGNKHGEGSGGLGRNMDGTGGIGGYGGAAEDASPAGWGIEIEWDNGRGGDGKSSVGAGGGGGFGGGGGSNRCNNETCGAGAGGGGSWARRATAENSFGLFLGKDNMPSNNNSGVVVLTIETIPIN